MYNKSRRNIQESVGKKAKLTRRDDEYEENAEDGCGREEKERKTEAEVDGQSECGHEGRDRRRRKTGLYGGNLSHQVG